LWAIAAGGCAVVIHEGLLFWHESETSGLGNGPLLPNPGAQLGHPQQLVVAPLV
jgi:hypothetical protein